MRGPWTGRTPAAMQKRIDALAKALVALPQHPQAPVSDPIFGDGPRPVAPPIPADMPPALAAAFVNLQAALDGPPCLGDQWPFANPPAVQAAIDAQRKRGRPPLVGSHQVIVVARFFRLGKGVAEAARRAKISERTARDIVRGIHPACKLPAVQVAGIEFPVKPRGGEIRGKFSAADPGGLGAASGPSAPNRGARK